MVCDSPDPPDSEAHLHINHDITVGSIDSDSDDETGDYSGYVRLPLTPEEEVLPSEGEEEEPSHTSSGNQSESNDTLPVITPMETVLVREVWSTSQSSSVDIQMDSKKVNEVKAAMNNFTLPAASIPEWARNVPEDEWKDNLIKRLQKLKGSS